MSTNPEKKKQLTVPEQLAEFGPGLTVELLQKVISDGESARQTEHKYHPPGTGGQLAYQTRILRSRLLLVPFKWTALNELNCAMVRNPAGDRRIVIARGDENTGLEDELPTTFYGKGTVLRRGTETNRQLALPGFEPSEDDNPTETWVLLVCTSETLDKEAGNKLVRVRSELSKPIAWYGNRPTDWDRIRLPEFTIEFGLVDEALPDFASEDDLDVDLTKKKK